MHTTMIAAVFLAGCSASATIPARQPAPLPANVRVFPLRYANADELVGVLMDLRDSPARRASWEAVYWHGAPLNGVILAPWLALDADMSAVADARTNSIVVSVPNARIEALDRISDMIHRLDVDVVAAR